MPKLLKALVESNFASLSINPDDRFAVAYSGGPDSTFLLECLYSMGFKDVLIIYINYHDTNRVDIEEKIVKETAARLKYELHNYDVNIKDIVVKNNLNFEDSARTIRYRIFREEYDKKPFDSLFVAHQKDDLIETYLMQKERKNLVNYWGIAPITYINGIKVVRPLLNITKEEIINYLNYSEIPFFDDYSNTNLMRKRNFIRAKKLPMLNKNKVVKEIMEENNKLLNQLKKLESMVSSLTKYSKYSQLSEDEKLRYLYMLIENACKNATSIKVLTAARNLAYQNLKKPNTSCQLHLFDDIYLYRNYGSFYIRKKIKTQPYFITAKKPGIINSKNFKIDLNHYEKFNLKPSDFPVTIRPYRTDDIFGTKIVGSSVKKFIKNNKVPKYLREIYPVIINKNGKIVCVPFFDDVKKKKVPLRFKSFKLG